MRRSNRRRSTAARIIGWGLVALAYAAVLVWAGAITGGEPAAAAGDAARAVAGAVGSVPDEAGSLAAIATPAEAPLVTLGLAAAMVAIAVVAYAVHTYRARHPRVRSARLIVRHITTLL
jgi:hypothetical protein